jgi:glycosyltransferase involved in cell wall biosynthesis
MHEAPLRILVAADVPANPNSGAAGTVFATNAALRALGHDVEEVWADDLPHRIRHWNLHYLLELPRAYRDVVRERSALQAPDVVQISQPHAWLAARDHRANKRRGVFVNRSHGLESMADAALAHWHRRLGVRPNRFPNSWVSPFLQKALRRHIDLTVRYADGLIVPASDIREHLVRSHGADPARVAVIHHGMPDEFIDNPRPALDGARLKRILHVGQYSFIKGPLLMARAVQEAFAADAGLQFTWVCDSSHHEEALSLFRPEFRRRVSMHPWVDQKSLLALYDTHGQFVAHSVYEGAAKACVEAMARGLVVVSSAVGALKDHVTTDVNGYLVEVGECEAMASALVDAGAQVERSARVGAAAAAQAKGLTWRACASASVDFYRMLSAQASVRAP